MVDIVIREVPIKKNIEMIELELEDALSQKNKTLPFWDNIIKMLPELDEAIALNYADEQIRKVVTVTLEKRFEQEGNLIKKSIEKKRQLVDNQIMPGIIEMLHMFELDKKYLSEINCFMGFFNPFPREVVNKNYYVHYDISDETFIKVSLHEINHMILFEKWKSMFGYDKSAEPQYPESLWYLEELSIEPTLNSKKMQELAPYRHSAYDSFYQIQIAGKSLPDIVNAIYKESENIEQYLVKMCQFLEIHKKEIDSFF